LPSWVSSGCPLVRFRPAAVPAPTASKVAPGTLVTWLATAGLVWAPPAAAGGGEEDDVVLTTISAITIASTAAMLPPVISTRRRISARRAWAR
jgi:hypothetical protein